MNGIDPSDRLPDPERLLSAYFHSAATVNHVRSLLASGFASLPSGSGQVPWSLPLSHVRSEELLKSYESIVQQLSSALEFMEVIGVERGNSAAAGALESADIFMSHEVRFYLRTPRLLFPRRRVRAADILPRHRRSCSSTNRP